MRFCSIDNCSQPVFGTDKITRLGYCKRHQYSRTDLSRKSIMQRAIEKQKGIENDVRSLKTLPENIEMLNKAKELKEWFAYHMANSEKVCENCKFDLSDYNEKDWRSSQDHIIEKSEKNGCPSIAAVLDNHCVLGMWCCHSQKHTSNLNLSKMAIFPTLKERFSKFEHLIAQDERKKIPDIFLP